MYDIDDSLTIWVGDLDAWINVDFSDEYETERQAEALQKDLAEIGDIPLLANKSISSRTLHSRGISPADWRWFLHEAEIALGDVTRQWQIERLLVRKLIDLGRGYAIGRYARWENLPYESALTATYPHGIRALLLQYAASEDLLCGSNFRPAMNRAIKSATEAEEKTAYSRVTIIQKLLHRIADRHGGSKGHLRLNKNGVRVILSLSRLHFAALEANLTSLNDWKDLNDSYQVSRLHARKMSDEYVNVSDHLSGRRIANWTLRHMHPLTYFYPFSIRNALARGVKHRCDMNVEITREQAANEIALAGIEMKLMRQRSIDRQKTK